MTQTHILYLWSGIVSATFAVPVVINVRNIIKERKRKQAQLRGDNRVETKVRRTLEKDEPVNLKVSELRVGFLVNLRDPEYNSELVTVKEIGENEVTFTNMYMSEAKKYDVILTRDGDRLIDAKGRPITARGMAHQFDYNGNEIL